MRRSDLPDGTVTLLFTDIEGSTRLLHAIGGAAYAQALAEHRAALREAFRLGDGVEVDTQGDAFLVAFRQAGQAALAAMRAHAALEGGPVSVRIGLHTGTPLVTDEGYVGADVHLGARIAALARGGQTLVSQATADALEGAELRSVGLHRLKDFDGAVPLHQLGPGEFPPPRTPGAVDLPHPPSAFVGREHELFGAVSRVLDHDPRALTVTGAGGTGKTRFAIELARLLADEAEGGTVFVEAAPLREPELLLPTIAARLAAADASLETIAARVAGRRTHLVVDNVEQLLPAAATALSSLVAAVPALRLIVTSREALRIGGEDVLDLPPLSPGDASELLVARARASGADVEPGTAVDELCARLDRLPLALELAAARMRTLTPEQVLERLSSALDLLRGPRDAVDRHATLRAAIGWSHDLLDADERRLFAQLAVFRAGWTVESAEAVARADVEVLTSLVDKSLVRRAAAGAERPFFMFEAVREFARERLAGDPALDLATRRRHAEHVLDTVRAAHLSSEDVGTEQDFDRAYAERDDVRAALDWAAERDRPLAAAIVVALEQFWLSHAPQEGERRVTALLAAGDDLPAALRARLLRQHGGAVMYLHGDAEASERSYREALALFRAIGDERCAVALLARFAVQAGQAADAAQARRLVAEVRRANETVRHPAVEPQMLDTLAAVAARQGDHEAALELYRQAAAAAHASRFALWEMWVLVHLLVLECALDRLEDAEGTGRRALALALRLHDRTTAFAAISGLALAALRRGDLRRAGLLRGAVVEAESRDPLLADDDEIAGLAAPFAGIAEPRLAAALEEGRVLSFEQAVAVALARTSDAAATAS